MARTPAGLRVLEVFLALVAVLLGVRAFLRRQERYASKPPQKPQLTQPIGNEAARKEVADESAVDPCDDLYLFVCGERKILQDPTGEVKPDLRGEVEALRMYEMILHKHPDWTSEEVDEELVKEIYTERRRKRLEDDFRWVRSAMKHYIDQQPRIVFSSRSKQLLKKRLDETVLQLPPPASLYRSEFDLFTKNDVYYGTLPDGTSVIRVGGAYLLTAKSRFNRVFTLAHELAHSIDPCTMSTIPLIFSAYGNLFACFQKNGFVSPTITSPKCSTSNPFSEVFADWIAVGITVDLFGEYQPRFASAKQGFNAVVNSVRDLCAEESTEEEEIQSHPNPRTRIEIIFGHHPRVRALLGCKTTLSNYCQFGKG